jgi:cytochrome oxidase assembly protein ShyY1
VAITKREEEKIMKLKILAWAGILIIFILLTLGSWFIGRKVNYTLSYKSMVKQTIIEMV